MGEKLAGRMLAKAREAAWRASYFEGPRLLSRLRKQWQVFRNPRATIRFGPGVFAGPGFKVSAPWGGTLIVGSNVEFRRDVVFELGGPDSKVSIGNDTHFTYGAVVQCTTTVTIGERVNLGQHTMIVDGNHKYRDYTKPFLEQGYDYREIIIGDEAAIHSKCTIVNSIGHRAIIGANTVITKEIPPFSIAGGVPARVLDYYGPPEAESPAGRAPAT